MKFTAYFDESGDSGIARIRDGDYRGASTFFVIAAVLIPEEEKENVRRSLQDISERIGKPLHAKELKHSERKFLCQEMAKLRIRLFATVSDKGTLGPYRDQIEQDARKYYNKCSQYAFERVLWFLDGQGAFEKAWPSMDYILEKRRHDYDQLRSFLGCVKDKPLHKNAKILRYLNTLAVEAKGKEDEPLLALADMVAYAVYALVNLDEKFGLHEESCFRMLQKRFGCDKDGKVLDHGIYLIKGKNKIRLRGDVQTLLGSTKADLPSTKL